MIYQAHRGVSTENPENTMPSVLAAIEQGFGIIELDVSATRDTQFVLMHDDTINRTARLKNGDTLPEPAAIYDMTYEEASEYDYGLWFSRKFRGVKLPLFRDILDVALKNNVKLKIDNKYQRFTKEQTAAFFELLKPYESVACLTCSTVDAIKYALEFFPKMHFHYDGEVSEEKSARLSELLPREQLTVWLPFRNKNTTWVSVPFADNDLASLVKRHASLGLWLLSDESEAKAAEELGADVIEINGNIKPPKNAGITADMHTHSESSHDSVCPVKEMCLSQIEKGTNVFAVTDHCDIFSFKDYDIFTPVKKAFDTVSKLKNEYRDKCLILSGVEVSEGIWYPKELEKLEGLCSFDVILGSVHCVRFGEISEPYSGIDFSLLTEEEIYAYLDAYFNDVMRIIKEYDFDVLAHLTCPLKYITGKYKISVDLSRFEEVTDAILREIIKRGIALEVNTSSCALLNDFMPPVSILKKYYDMGGYLITTGSDAHTAADASSGFKIAKQTLKEIGFKNLYYYKNRQAIQYLI